MGCLDTHVYTGSFPAAVQGAPETGGPGSGEGGVDQVSSRESQSQDSIHFKLLISPVYARMTSPNLNM